MLLMETRNILSEILEYEYGITLVAKYEFNSSANDNLNSSKFKAHAEDKINVIKNQNLLGKRRKHFGKRRKCWLPAFSTFLKTFS